MNPIKLPYKNVVSQGKGLIRFPTLFSEDVFQIIMSYLEKEWWNKNLRLLKPYFIKHNQTKQKNQIYRPPNIRYRHSKNKVIFNKSSSDVSKHFDSINIDKNEHQNLYNILRGNKKYLKKQFQDFNNHLMIYRTWRRKHIQIYMDNLSPFGNAFYRHNDYKKCKFAEYFNGLLERIVNICLDKKTLEHTNYNLSSRIVKLIIKINNNKLINF